MREEFIDAAGGHAIVVEYAVPQLQPSGAAHAQQGQAAKRRWTAQRFEQGGAKALLASAPIERKRLVGYWLHGGMLH